jgi:hypothetical protein
MADDKISFLLDLDIKEFAEKGLAAKGVIQEIGKSENLSGLLEGLMAAAPILAIVGAAALAFKESIDLTVEGEQIKRINTQFENLTAQAGIATTELKEGLKEASKGLVDDTDLLKIANEALVKMGGSAERLPEIMEIATKATQVYGGDAKSNFEAISTAIANGNTRILKHYGIIVDAEKAVRNFAAANNISTNELSDAGKKQAILNQALEQAQEQYKNISVDTKEATNTIQALKVTFEELKETFVLAFEKTMGPQVRSFLGSIKEVAETVKNTFQAKFGEGAEQAAAKITLTKNKITELEEQIKRLEETAKGSTFLGARIPGLGVFGASSERAKEGIKELQVELSKYQGQLKELEVQNDKIGAKAEVNDAKRIAALQKKSEENIIDLEKHKAAELAFAKDKEKINKETYDLEVQNVTSLDQINTLMKQRDLTLTEQHEESIAAIKVKYATQADKLEEMLALENKKFNQQKILNEQSAAQEKIKLLDNYAKHSTSIDQGIERSFRANTLKMKAEQADMGKRGNEMWNSLSTNATSAFTNMGAEMAKGKDIASATADAMKGFFLGFLGDRAIAEGSVMMLSGIWPPNPLALAGGAALMALGGALKSLAGPGAAGSTAASSPSSQAISAGATAPTVDISTASSSTDTQTMAAKTQGAPQRLVNVNIAGNYLETDSTKRMLMDLMRQESDATGFNYNQIGA